MDAASGIVDAGLIGSVGTMPNLDCGGPGCLLEPGEIARRSAQGQKPVCEETVICPRRFWGFMHSSEVPVQQVATVKPPEGETQPFLATAIHAANPVEVVTAFNPNLAFSKRHEDALANYPRDGPRSSSRRTMAAMR